MCCENDGQASIDHELAELLKRRALKGSAALSVVLESEEGTVGYKLEDGEVQRRAAPSAGRAASSAAAFEAALSGFADIVPKPEGEFDAGGRTDPDAVGIVIREMAHTGGAAAYGSLPGRFDAELPTPECPQRGRTMERHRKHVKTFASRLGPVEVKRIHCRCRACGVGFLPLDRAPGPEGRSATPGAENMAADAVIGESYGEASRKLSNLSGVGIPPTTPGRLLHRLGGEAQRFGRESVEEGEPGADRVYVGPDGTGVPMRRDGTEGVKGKREDGSSGTKEAKVIVTFTAGDTDPETGEPVKDGGSGAVSALIDSAASVGGVSGGSDFAGRLDRHPLREGVYGAREVVVISDGAAWIRNTLDEIPAGMKTTCIPDAFHALEYLSDALGVPFPCRDGHKARMAEYRAWLLNGGVAGIIAALAPHRTAGAAVAKCIDCFESNKLRMRYDEYRARGMQTGSGAVEAACRKTVAARFRKSGAKWSKRGANALPALKCCWENSRWDEFSTWNAQRIASA